MRKALVFFLLTLGPLVAGTQQRKATSAPVRPGVEAVAPWSSPQIAAKQGGLWGLINREGAWLIRPMSQRPMEVSDEVGLVSFVTTRGGAGWVDRTGRVVIKPIYDSVGKFEPTTGLACVVFKNKMGHVDRTGAQVIPPRFDCPAVYELATFSFHGPSGLALVKVGKPKNPIDALGPYGFIDRTGALVIAADLDDARPFRGKGDLTVAARNRKYGFMDRTGTFVVPPRFDGLCDLDEASGTAVFTMGNEFGYSGGRYGLIDVQGKELIPACHAHLEPMHPKTRRVPYHEDNKMGWLDATGNMVVKAVFENTERLDTEADTWIVSGPKGKIGVVDSSGAVVVPFKLDGVQRRDSSNRIQPDPNCLSVYMGKVKGFMDAKGQWIGKVAAGTLDPMDSATGLAALKVGQRWGLVDRTGRLVVPARFEDLVWEHFEMEED